MRRGPQPEATAGGWRTGGPDAGVGPAPQRRGVWRPLTTLACTLLALSPLPTPASAQTVARIYEPFATGAATTIYPGEDALGATDLVDLLQWYVPGLQVTRCPDGRIGIEIRGGRDGLLNPPPCDANPLLIIDGVKITGDNFSSEILSLNPFRVERVTVLRDVASTSVYGTRAADGVILIFTRRR